MPNPVYTRYALDKSGCNPDNLIVEELHTLSDKPLRFVVPKHNPFYVDSVQIYDGVTRQPLTVTTELVQGQYQVPTITQEATLRLGMAVADSILITDSNVASTVYITYQTVGGLYSHDITNIANIYEAYLHDERNIDWATAIFGKPNTYPPGPHPHYLTDVFGFETLTFILEQIRQAILLGNTPAYEALMNMQISARNKATIEDVDQGVVNNKLVPLDVLQYATQRYNYNTITMTPNSHVYRTAKYEYLVRASNAPRFDQYFWSIEHGTSDVSDFVSGSGMFSMSAGEGRFKVAITRSYDRGHDRVFKIRLHRGSPQGYVIYTSGNMTIPRYAMIISDDMITMCHTHCFNAPNVLRTARTHGMFRGIWDAKQS